jgi:hypothetical protein
MGAPFWDPTKNGEKMAPAGSRVDESILVQKQTKKMGCFKPQTFLMSMVDQCVLVTKQNITLYGTFSSRSVQS